MQNTSHLYENMYSEDSMPFIQSLLAILHKHPTYKL